MNMFNKVTSQSLEKEVSGIVSAFTSTVEKLNNASEKALSEATAKREEIKTLEAEASALDAISAKALKYADKLKSLFD
jgi:hypothetical protein